MVLKYTKEKLDSFDKETLIQLFLSQQEQLENIDHTLQLVLEQVSDLKRHRFGRSSERHETVEQICYYHTGLLQFCIGMHYLPFTKQKEVI